MQLPPKDPQVLYKSCKKKKNCEILPMTCHEGAEREYRKISTLSLSKALDGDGWLAPHPGHFICLRDVHACEHTHTHVKVNF